MTSANDQPQMTSVYIETKPDERPMSSFAPAPMTSSHDSTRNRCNDCMNPGIPPQPPPQSTLQERDTETTHSNTLREGVKPQISNPPQAQFTSHAT
mmetsp:Transcript_19675/g.23603  ORF Transcript_19675/g.23603 Transcript_19675/m.23603 type:complete len:96 (-) Transcript_19675:369-656(-)